jgi:lysophospholipase L1-like esterase
LLLRRVRGVGGALVALVAGLTLVAPVQAAVGANAPKYLLALGDSLAAGYQPADGTKLPPPDPTSGFPDKGYPASYAADIASARGLQLIDLGCPGETSATMLGTPAQQQCATLYTKEFGARSQLAAAETFLRRHPGKVAAVTIDIGSNDLEHCVLASELNMTCLRQSDLAMEKNLVAAFGPLENVLQGVDPAARITSMDYYDPFLGLAFSPGGIAGVKLAAESVPAIKVFNAELLATYRLFGLNVAQVASSFHLNDLLPLGRYDGKTVPRDVFETCTLTWMCPTASGTVPDIHPNNSGYRVIAAAFEKQIPSSVGSAP